MHRGGGPAGPRGGWQRDGTCWPTSSSRLRRRVPQALLPLLVGVRFLLAWSRRVGARRRPRRRCASCSSRRGPTPTSRRGRAAYVRGQIWRGELRWHPELITRPARRRASSTCWPRASRGRGVMLNFMHHGTYEGALRVARRGSGYRRTWSSTPTCCATTRPRWLKQHMRVGLHRRRRRASAPRSARRGSSTCSTRARSWRIASDVPGRTPLRFAGREVMGSFGAARIAADAGSPVVVMTSELDERGPVRPPARAARARRTSSHPQALLEEMLARHEKRDRPVAGGTPTCRCPGGAASRRARCLTFDPRATDSSGLPVRRPADDASSPELGR